MPVNKAVGADGLPIKAIKLGLDSLVGPLTRLVNKTIDLGFPKEFKRAIILPIYKKGDKSQPNNYRPISILPAISKVAERIIADKLNNYINENSLMNRAQHGF